MNGLEVFHILGTNMLQALYQIEKKSLKSPLSYFVSKCSPLKRPVVRRVFIFLLFTHMVVTVLCKLNFSVLSCPLLSHQPTNSEV